MSRAAGSAAVRRAADGFDLVVVGGGIYGLMVALEAARSGLRPLLAERGQLGGATTGAWFRILHGGFRYLQTLDVPRLLASVAERRWFLGHFPDLVRPHPFLMPLYGRGLKRAGVFRLAFLVEACLAVRRNAGLRADRRIPAGRVLDNAALAALYPGVRRAGLRGGALWHDAIAPDDTRLIGALADRARQLGATVLEGTEVTDLVTRGGRVTGAVLRDVATQAERQVSVPAVVNAAGPWGAALAARFGSAAPDLFRPALGFNLLLDRPPPAEVGLALVPPGRGGPMLFVYPLDGRTFAGTWYTPWDADPAAVRPSAPAIAAFLDALNACAPTLGARGGDVLRVFAGLLPATASGATTLTTRDIVRDHGSAGGPAGLISVSGVKYTTARRVAEGAVRCVLAARSRDP